MNFFKRLIWLCFYIPAAVTHQLSFARATIKRFFNRPVSQVKALVAGLAGGFRGGVKELRSKNS